MLVLKLNKSGFHKLVDGTKKGTSRHGHRQVAIGDDLLLAMTDNLDITYKTKCTNVYWCKFAELTEEEAHIEGYQSLDEMKDALTALYNPQPDDEFTLIHFN